MQFLVGSKNMAVKVAAPRELKNEFLSLFDSTIESGDGESGITKQPMTLEEIFEGATHRAAGCLDDTDEPDTYGIGIESGLIQVGNQDVWFDVTACVIWGGGGLWRGLSWGFQVPGDVMTFIHQGLDLSEAAKAAGYTDKEKVGNEEGIIGILTGGRMPRIEQAKSAVRMAFYAFERSLMQRP